MSLKEKLSQDKPWTALGWTRRQWKRSKMWKKAGVTEEKMGQLLQNLDHDFLQEMKDQATAEVLVEKMFGTAGDRSLVGACSNPWAGGELY